MVSNIKQLETLSDADIQASLGAVSEWCGQEIVRKMRKHAGQGSGPTLPFDPPEAQPMPFFLLGLSLVFCFGAQAATPAPALSDASLPDLSLSWRHGAAVLSVVVPAGEHIAPAAPVHGFVDQGDAHTEWAIAGSTLQSGLHLGVVEGGPWSVSFASPPDRTRARPVAGPMSRSPVS